MLLVDTNIFLEHLLGQSGALDVEQFLAYAFQQNMALTCTHFSVHGIESILSNKKKWKELELFLDFLQQMPNITIYETTIAEEQTITKLARQQKLDFDDALQYFVAKQTHCKVIVSFDAHFDKTDLPRKTPFQLLPKKKPSKR